MQLPTLCDKSFDYCREIVGDKALFDLLVKTPPQLIDFFITACEDETWSTNHGEFMTASLQWMTEAFYQDKLMMEFASKIGKVIRLHYNNLKKIIPRNITLKLKDRDLTINGLLYGSASEFIREMLRRECRDKKKKILHLDKIEFAIMSPIDYYLNTGSDFELIHNEKAEVIKVLNLTLLWELDELADACQNVLKKYITRENLFETLLKSHKKGRRSLLQSCYDFANELKLGYRLEDRGSDYIAFEFLDFNENSYEAFNALREEITHLIFGGKTTEEADFVKVIEQCPKLISLDIGRASSFTVYMREIPTNLKELDLSSSLWIDDEKLLFFIERCPLLNSLRLVSDVKLGLESWGGLQNLPELHRLDLTRCAQLGNADLSLILQACPTLTVLILEDCRNIDDEGFFELTKYEQSFTILNLKHCKISELPLIELATHSDVLYSLNLSRCEFLTDKALYELVKNVRTLKEVDISHCDISEGTIKDVRTLKPYLKLLV